MNQQRILRLAKRQLGLSYPGLAGELGVATRSLEKWVLHGQSGDHREMPLTARKLLARLLVERAQEHIAAGNREAAEPLEALASQSDPAMLRRALRVFDGLQHAADTLAPMRAPPRKPRHFRSPAAKNAWQEREDLAHARHARAKSARHR